MNIEYIILWDKTSAKIFSTHDVKNNVFLNFIINCWYEQILPISDIRDIKILEVPFTLSEWANGWINF